MTKPPTTDRTSARMTRWFSTGIANACARRHNRSLRFPFSPLRNDHIPCRSIQKRHSTSPQRVVQYRHPAPPPAPRSKRHRARCISSTLPPATSCLGASPTPALRHPRLPPSSRRPRNLHISGCNSACNFLNDRCQPLARAFSSPRRGREIDLNQLGGLHDIVPAAAAQILSAGIRIRPPIRRIREEHNEPA